jgi:16S rRNA (guanine(966)-N(2))-methyltransferase RsmD
LGELDGSRVLDLFAGTGALGIEAISRGAECLVSVDRSRQSAEAIEHNLEEFRVASQARVIRADARAAIRRLDQSGEVFDLVFLDPPYVDLAESPAVLNALVACDILDPDAVVVVEGPKRHSLERIPGLVLEKERRYGDTVVYWLGVDPAGRDPRRAKRRESRDG